MEILDKEPEPDPEMPALADVVGFLIENDVIIEVDPEDIPELEPGDDANSHEYPR